jgi:ribosomal protein S18 acetylase RimI-like enzyme
MRGEASTTVDSHIQSYIRFAASDGRDVEQVGPFLATFDRYSDNPYRNYAIPDDEAEPSSDDVTALIAAYEHHRRTPRLEYLTSIAPTAESALLMGGFMVEGRLPLMTCSLGSLRDLPMPPDVEFVSPVTDDDFLATATVQQEAYGGPPLDQHDIDRLRVNVATGGIVVLARNMVTGEPIGAGLCSVPRNGITEIAAVGVRPAYRRRGVASALTVQLVRQSFDAGVTMPFLMAAHEAEERIYARVGFTKISQILHTSVPEVRFDNDR